MKKFNYKHTICACFIAYMVQAVVCNFAPLLFVGWKNEFNISITQLTSIITVTFVTQIIVDLLSAKFADKIGYKLCLITAHLCSALGFLLLGTLPYAVNHKYAAIMLSVVIYSIGSGLLEVLISPVVESCPTDNKTGTMSLLHSFYCWGSVAVILTSTLFFVLFSRDNWRYLSLFWASFSFLNSIFFCLTPIIEPNKEKSRKQKSPFKISFFYTAIILMICAGAAELAMSQWVSAFAEEGLGVSKAVGDLAGPMAFAVLMGSGRILFSKLSSIVKIESYLKISAILCIISYIFAALSSNAVISLAGCALCGFCVSAMWPATISLTTQKIPDASTAIFAFLALSGDVGCTFGPTLVGYAANAFGGSLKKGLIFAALFPAIIIISILLTEKTKSHSITDL